MASFRDRRREDNQQTRIENISRTDPSTPQFSDFAMVLCCAPAFYEMSCFLSFVLPSVSFIFSIAWNFVLNTGICLITMYSVKTSISNIHHTLLLMNELRSGPFNGSKFARSRGVSKS